MKKKILTVVLTATVVLFAFVLVGIAVQDADILAPVDATATDGDATPTDIITIMLGDMDGDGVIRAQDARLVLRMAVGLPLDDATATDATATDAEYPEELMLIADVANELGEGTPDGKVTAADARYVLRIAVGLEEVGVRVLNDAGEPTIIKAN